MRPQHLGSRNDRLRCVARKSTSGAIRRRRPRPRVILPSIFPNDILLNGNNMHFIHPNSSKDATLATTEFPEEKFNFSWQLKKFRSLPESLNLQDLKSFDSPIFTVNSKPASQWQIFMQLEEKEEEATGLRTARKIEYIGIYLRLVSRPFRAKLQFKLSVFGLGEEDGSFEENEGIPITDIRKSKVHSLDKGLELGWQYFLRSSKLTDFAQGAIKIDCQLVFQHDPIHSLPVARILLEKEEMEKSAQMNLANDLSKLRSSESQSDVMILVENTELRAHKAILCARSPVFQRMFEVDMAEKNNSIVEIKDFDKETVNGMLEFIYTGGTSMMATKTCDLIQISEKYQLSDLKRQCELSLILNLDVERAAEILVLADMINTTFLKKSVIQFINMNKETVKKTQGFKDLVASKHRVIIDLYTAEIPSGDEGSEQEYSESGEEESDSE